MFIATKAALLCSMYTQTHRNTNLTTIFQVNLG